MADQKTVSNSYLKRMQTLFYLMDTNKDRLVSKEELFEAQSKAYEKADVYYRNVHNSEEEAWGELFPDDKASFEDFLATHSRGLGDNAWRRKLEVLYDPIFERQFQTIDLNKDGYISLREYQKHINSYWVEPENADEIARTQFHEIDENKDGMISVDEYVAWQQRYILGDDPNDPIDLWGWLVSDEEWDRYNGQ